MKYLARSLYAAFAGIVLCSFAAAQDGGTIRSAAGSQYLISAKAGGVNLVQGDVQVRRNNSTSGPLVKGDTVNVGDRVITGPRSRAEILLNPGSYVRLNENSEFEFVTTDLDDLKLKLIRGSAIFEVYADGEFFVTVLSREARFYLIKSGVYRVDAFEDGTSRIEVRKGKAQVGGGNGADVKKGRAAFVTRNTVNVIKFDRGDRDEFEWWSRNRSKSLAKANDQFKRRNVRRSIWSTYSSFGGSRYDAFGLWVFNPYTGFYCYLPFNSTRRTPYGYRLNRTLSSYTSYSYSPRNNTSTNVGNTNTGGVIPVVVESRRELRRRRLKNRTEFSGESGADYERPNRRAGRKFGQTNVGEGGRTIRRTNGNKTYRPRRSKRRSSSGKSGTTVRRGSSSSRRSTTPRRAAPRRSAPRRTAPRRAAPPRRSPPPRRTSPPPRTKSANKDN